MALEFSDWGLSPEEKVASRKQALDAYTNIAYPMEEERQRMEKGKLASDTYQQSVQAAKAGEYKQGSDVLAKARQQAAQLIPEQQKRADELRYTGAMDREKILSAKQGAAVGDYERTTQEYKDQAATQLANRAFEMGYQGKELALSNNAFVADRGLNQMYADLQAGRITQNEVRDIGQRLKLKAVQLQADLKRDLEGLKGQLELDLANKDMAAAQKRIADMIKRAEEAAESAAKSSSLGAMLSGVFGIATGAATFVATGNPALAFGVGKASAQVAEGVGAQL